jgi:hypothetical protein
MAPPEPIPVGWDKVQQPEVGVLHQCHILEFNGDSYRFKESLRLQGGQFMMLGGATFGRRSGAILGWHSYAVSAFGKERPSRVFYGLGF